MNKTDKGTAIKQGLINLLIVTMLIIFVMIVSSSCTSHSKQMVENRVTERCIVVDSYTLKTDEGGHRHYLKIMRESDNTIHGKLTHNMQLYEIGDTILMPFDKRYDY